MSALCLEHKRDSFTEKKKKSSNEVKEEDIQKTLWKEKKKEGTDYFIMLWNERRKKGNV